MSAGRRFPGRERGFTLIECLVALVIFSLATVALHRGLSGGIRGLARSDQQVRAVELARGLMASAGIETPMTPGRTEGMTDDGLVWAVDVVLRDEVATQRTRRTVAAYDVTVTVHFDPAPAQPPAVTLTTIRLAPVPPT